MTTILMLQQTRIHIPTIEFQSPNDFIHLPYYEKNPYFNIHAEYHLNSRFHVYENILNE